MKALKIFMVMVIAVTCILPTLAANEAQAAPMWVTCFVNGAGQGGGSKLIKVTDAKGVAPTINGTWFTISNTYGGAKDMLATSLTAMASGLKVQIYVSDTVPYSQVMSVYLLEK
jgi:hypothetical protein